MQTRQNILRDAVSLKEFGMMVLLGNTDKHIAKKKIISLSSKNNSK